MLKLIRKIWHEHVGTVANHAQHRLSSSHPVYVALIFLFFVASCSPFKVGEEYKKPTIKISQNWQNVKPLSFAEIENNWWENFNDPLLNYLIVIALQNNYDYRIALSKVLEARANVDLKDSDLFPKVNIAGSGARRSNFFNPINPNQHRIINFFTAGFDASWELDLFGENQRAKQSAKALWQASTQAKNYILISLIAEVVRNYIDFRNAQNQLFLQRNIDQTYLEIVKINEKKRDSGLISDIDFAKIKIALLDSKSALVEAEAQVKIALHNLELLLGKQPGEMRIYLREVAEIPLIKKNIIASAPLALLRNRPDVIQAERELESSVALEGYALAQVFPKISLSGFLGFYNTRASNLLNSSGRVFSSQADISMPVINFGGLRAAIKISGERKKQALLNYESKVNQALFDAEIAMVDLMKEDEKLFVETQVFGFNNMTNKLQRERKDSGATSHLDYLNSVITTLEARQKLNRARLNYSLKTVAFYKAMGGGWR